MNESNSTTRVRLGTIANSLIESHNRPAASKKVVLFMQKIIDLVTSMDHCVSHFIEPVENWDQDMSVSLAAMAKELLFIRQTQADFPPKDTARQDTIRLAK